MDALVKNFRGIERAQIRIAPIALLAGFNHVGKSSVCQAVAAALTGYPIPFIEPNKRVGDFSPKLTKTESKELVRGGTDEGSVVVSIGKDTIRVDWPKLKASSEGVPPQASVYAAGLIKIMELQPMYRFELLSTLLETTPSNDDLTVELKDIKLDDATIAQVITKIGEVGFDGAHRALSDATKQLKGRWEEATGEAFGLKKMEGWKPEGYDLTEGVTSEQDVTNLVANARQSLETAIAAQAVDGAEIERLTKLAPLEHDAEEALNAANTELAAHQADLKRAQDDLASIVVPAAPMPCPECGVMIGASLTDGKITLHRPRHTMAEIKTIEGQRDSANGMIILIKTRITAAQAKRATALADHQLYVGTKAKLESVIDKKGSAEDVTKAREGVAAAESLQAKFMSVYRATKLAATIKINTALLGVLEPEGLRRKKLANKLQLFNNTMLLPLTQVAGYQPVTIDEELNVRCGGRHYFLLSESEMFRVNVVLQISIALLDQSPIVIIDGADILDVDGRNGLFAMLSSAGERLKSLVAMTVASKKSVPDLAKHGMGMTYWIEGGACAEFKL